MVSAFPDVTVTERSPEDEYILLACDGLWDVKTTEEAIEEVSQTIYNNNFTQTLSMTDFVVGVENLIDTCWSRDRFANQGLG